MHPSLIMLGSYILLCKNYQIRISYRLVPKVLLEVLCKYLIKIMRLHNYYLFYPGKSHIFDFLDTLVFLSLSFDLWPDLVIDLIYEKSHILFTQLFNSINTLIALISLSLFLISFLDLFKFLFKSWMSLFMWSLSSNVLASWIYENFTFWQLTLKNFRTELFLSDFLG